VPGGGAWVTKKTGSKGGRQRQTEEKNAGFKGRVVQATRRGKGTMGKRKLLVIRKKARGIGPRNEKSKKSSQWRTDFWHYGRHQKGKKN